MNVQSPSWLGQIPNPQLPLSSGLRAVFEIEQELPADIRRLLSQLDQGASSIH